VKHKGKLIIVKEIDARELGMETNAEEVGSSREAARATPESDEVLPFVRDLIAEFVEIPGEMVDDEADLFKQYRVESLQLVELMGAVEGRFRVHLDFADFETARTVAAVSRHVSRLAAE
jgi:acyl carrier protein